MNFRNSLVAAAATSAAIGLMSMPAQAAGLFGNTGIKFDKDTVLKFDFVSSNGEYRSDLGVFEAGADEPVLLKNLITEVAPGFTSSSPDYPGKCVVCSASFKFLAGVEYTLGLTSEGRIKKNSTELFDKGVVYSTDSLNDDGNNAIFSGNLNSASGVKIIWDDNGNGPDNDFNDFIVETRAVPEPATLAGLGLVAGSFLMSRRRKATQA